MTLNELELIAEELSVAIHEKEYRNDFGRECIDLCDFCEFRYSLKKECGKIPCIKGVEKWIYNYLYEYLDFSGTDDINDLIGEGFEI